MMHMLSEPPGCAVRNQEKRSGVQTFSISLDFYKSEQPPSTERHPKPARRTRSWLI
jgi:hypothetical protein